ncbi:MAG TPA: hypothetical protein VFJ57_08650 [Solirubrobacterales bacterium]|nr:hypothetical protein [Solirubrobacterales bacterium]
MVRSVEAGDAEARKRRNYLWGGAILIGLAVLAFVLLGKDDSSGCALGAAGVDAIVVGLNRGHSVEAIVGSAAVGTACAAAVKSFSDEPEKAVTINIITPSGEEEPETTSGVELIEPAEEPTEPGSSPELERYFACFASYVESEFLTQACREGLIEPQ